MALVSAKAKIYLHGQPASDYQPTHTSHSLKNIALLLTDYSQVNNIAHFISSRLSLTYLH